LKILTEENCPHCKKSFESAKDLEGFEPTQAPQNKGTVKTIESNAQQTMIEPEIKEIIKEVTKLPKTQPNYKCKDGRCGNLHPNPDYEAAPSKKCENCGQFGDGETCVYCNGNEFEDIDADELEELGIKMPEIPDHVHE
jgi:hypothetical protein